MLPELATYCLTPAGAAALEQPDWAAILIAHARAAQAWRRLVALDAGHYGVGGTHCLPAARAQWRAAEADLAALLEATPCKP